ncbi:MAG: aldehyde dehydrogenase family protein, partial [Phycisphaerae bacterium]|nr:aldehyde dehydrogenase family protein [Phycisphaerae bacterium]
MTAQADFIGGRWIELDTEGLSVIQSVNPAKPPEVVWRGAPRMEHVSQAVAAARRALPAWSASTRDERIAVLQKFAEQCTKAAPAMAALITREVGKTLAESALEAKLLADKVAITTDPQSLGRVSDYDVAAGASRTGHCRFKPLGVMAVVGPFNFPAHLPNGHIVPALLLGNTVVFKPSEKAPAVGQELARLFAECVPPGVFNLVQGTGEHAAALTGHDDVDGILFTGSWPVGRRILQANLDRPGRMVALEMGGNNASVVLDDADLRLAVVECARAAFATTGQRCTCTRRIVVQRGIADRFLRALVQVAKSITVGAGDSDPPVFMGPLVTRQARDAVLAFQQDVAARGGRVLVAAEARDPGWLLTPGVVQVDRFTRTHDTEVFGPLVQVAIADTLDDAIAQANATEYGLAAAIFTRSRESFERFFAQ